MLSTPLPRTHSVERKRVAVLGSTGSIGVSALKVISSNPDRFELVAISANSNSELLAKQILEYQPKYAAIGNSTALSALQSVTHTSKCKLLSGEDGVCEIAQLPEIDAVLLAIVGFAAIKPLLCAINADKQIALANKESLVAAGELVKETLAGSSAVIIPVDSEHSAIFQVLHAADRAELESITLTASGGPFLNTPESELRSITPEQAVKHPRWNMGAKISIDSATLMNKALEVIEAHWLFDLAEEQIQVVVHPQSIIHSMISLRDGSVLAQMSVPDMCGPIALALGYPGLRLPKVMLPLDLARVGKLEFFELDSKRFPAVTLAKNCIVAGGILPSVLNCANEEAVSAFMDRKISFDRIVPIIDSALAQCKNSQYSSLKELLEVQIRVKAIVNRLVSETL